MNFEDTSTKIAQEFLQSVLVVDDRAFDEQDQPDVTGDLEAPGRSDSNESTLATSVDTKEQQPSTEPEDEARDDEVHNFKPELLINEFSTWSLFCSVLSPKGGDFEALSSQVSPAAKRADIIVFDWVLDPGGSGEGQETLQLINQIIEDDEDNSEIDRLRQIAIYTGTRELNRIVDSISASLDQNRSDKRTEKIDDFTLRQGNVQISVYAKGTARITEETPDLYQRKKSIEELPKVLIEDFSRMTRGLVSNAAVHSLTMLRKNTFRLLSTFHPGLDAPYLEHRAMLTVPEDAEEYLIRLITSEIGAVLEAAEVRRYVDLNHIESWLDRMFPSMEPDSIFRNGKDPRKQSILSLLDQGAGGVNLPDDLINFGSNGQNAHKKGIAEAISKNDANSEDKVSEFATLTLLKSKYEMIPPILTLGTILRTDEGEAGKYWLCVQPRCDSVRIQNCRRFPLLPTEIVTDNKRRHLVLEDGGKYHKLKIDFTPHMVAMVEFKAEAESTVIRPVQEEGFMKFISTSGAKFVWVADLKFEHAQRVAQRFSNKLSRVGLDESEWLRRKSP